MQDPNNAIWSIWSGLGFLSKAYFLVLLALTAYTLFSAIVIVRGSFSATNRRAVLELRARCRRVRDLLAGFFFLFGFIFFFSLQYVQNTLTGGKTFPAKEILGNLLAHFAFAENVFFVFFGLQLVQSYVSYRIHQAELRMQEPG
jgi:hypothetical protein